MTELEKVWTAIRNVIFYLESGDDKNKEIYLQLLKILEKELFRFLDY